jgi:hypothetical protein
MPERSFVKGLVSGAFLINWKRERTDTPSPYGTVGNHSPSKAGQSDFALITKSQQPNHPGYNLV